MTEKQWQQQVVDLARALGWAVMDRPPVAAAENDPLPPADDVAAGLGDSLVGTVLCELTLEGEPATKYRVRVSKGRAYSDPRTRVAEQAIQWQLLGRVREPDADHLLRVDLKFRSSTGQRRDLDNLVKLTLDACNKFIWRDDVQVVEIHAAVDRRSADVGTDLKVTRVGRYTSDCKRCGKALQVGKGKPAGRDGYCSRACYDEAQRQGGMVACPECGAPVYRQRSEEGKAKFCSRACSHEHKRETRWTQDRDGFPDLLLVKPPRMLAVELVLDSHEIGAAQQSCLDDLRACDNVEVYVWRPRDFKHVHALLRERTMKEKAA